MLRERDAEWTDLLAAPIAHDESLQGVIISGPGRGRAGAVEIARRVKDGDQERIIRYMPEGRSRITVQEMQLKPGVAAEECARSMSGIS